MNSSRGKCKVKSSTTTENRNLCLKVIEERSVERLLFLEFGI